MNLSEAQRQLGSILLSGPRPEEEISLAQQASSHALETLDCLVKSLSTPLDTNDAFETIVLLNNIAVSYPPLSNISIGAWKLLIPILRRSEVGSVRVKSLIPLVENVGMHIRRHTDLVKESRGKDDSSLSLALFYCQRMSAILSFFSEILHTGNYSKEQQEQHFSTTSWCYTSMYYLLGSVSELKQQLLHSSCYLTQRDTVVDYISKAQCRSSGGQRSEVANTSHIRHCAISVVELCSFCFLEPNLENRMALSKDGHVAAAWGANVYSICALKKCADRSSSSSSSSTTAGSFGCSDIVNSLIGMFIESAAFITVFRRRGLQCNSTRTPFVHRDDEVSSSDEQYTLKNMICSVVPSVVYLLERQCIGLSTVDYLICAALSPSQMQRSKLRVSSGAASAANTSIIPSLLLGAIWSKISTQSQLELAKYLWLRVTQSMFTQCHAFDVSSPGQNDSTASLFRTIILISHASVQHLLLQQLYNAYQFLSQISTSSTVHLQQLLFSALELCGDEYNELPLDEGVAKQQRRTTPNSLPTRQLTASSRRVCRNFESLVMMLPTVFLLEAAPLVSQLTEDLLRTACGAVREYCLMKTTATTTNVPGAGIMAAATTCTSVETNPLSSVGLSLSILGTLTGSGMNTFLLSGKAQSHLEAFSTNTGIGTFLIRSLASLSEYMFFLTVDGQKPTIGSGGSINTLFKAKKGLSLTIIEKVGRHAGVMFQFLLCLRAHKVNKAVSRIMYGVLWEGAAICSVLAKATTINEEDTSIGREGDVSQRRQQQRGYQLVLRVTLNNILECLHLIFEKVSIQPDTNRVRIFLMPAVCIACSVLLL